MAQLTRRYESAKDVIGGRCRCELGLMACITGGRGRFETPALMTRLTRNRSVRTRQWKRSEIVIEACIPGKGIT